MKLYLYLILGITALVFSSSAVCCPDAFLNKLAKDLNLVRKEFSKAKKFSSLDKFIHQMALTLKMSEAEVKSYIVAYMGYVNEEEFTKDIVETVGVRSQPEWLTVQKIYEKVIDYYPADPQKLYPNFMWPEQRREVEELPSRDKLEVLKTLMVENKMEGHVVKTENQGALEDLLIKDIVSRSSLDHLILYWISL